MTLIKSQGHTSLASLTSHSHFVAAVQPNPQPSPRPGQSQASHPGFTSWAGQIFTILCASVPVFIVSPRLCSQEPGSRPQGTGQGRERYWDQTLEPQLGVKTRSELMLRAFLPLAVEKSQVDLLDKDPTVLCTVAAEPGLLDTIHHQLPWPHRTTAKVQAPNKYCSAAAGGQVLSAHRNSVGSSTILYSVQ